MRLATARDELVPLLDPKVQQHEAFMSLVLLARVVTRLGTVTAIDDQVIGGMWATDLAFLQDIYRRINTEGTTVTEVVCPHCQGTVMVDLAGDAPGES